MEHKDIKTDVGGLYRSPEGFLINKDNTALEAYKARKQKDRELIELREEVSSIKNDMQEIKELLKGLVK